MNIISCDFRTILFLHINKSIHKNQGQNDEILNDYDESNEKSIK